MRLRIALVTFLILPIGCASTHQADSPRPGPTVPSYVVTGSRNALISWVGRDFFNVHLTLDSNATYCWSDSEREARGMSDVRFSLRYRLSSPTQPWVHGFVRVDVDSTGRNAGTKAVRGVSNCARYPEECTFKYNHWSAEHFARFAGLQRGIAAWKTSFEWAPDATPPCYVWLVQNTLAISDASTRGEQIAVDASTGRIVPISGKTITEWAVYRDFARQMVPGEDRYPRAGLHK